LTTGSTAPFPTPLWWDLYIHPLPIFALLILNVVTEICTWTWNSFNISVANCQSQLLERSHTIKGCILFLCCLHIHWFLMLFCLSNVTLPSFLSKSEHNYEPVPSTSHAQKDCSKKHHNVILRSSLPLQCGYFQRVLPKCIALAYPIWSS
jgi:hypothetical protein